MSLVVFEGVDGTGKSTQVRMLAARIEEEMPQQAVVTLAEPTDSRPGRKIREVLECSDKRLSFQEELELFVADRQINVSENILPALAAGKVVVMDRYYFSTAAYQGSLGKMDHEQILALNEAFAPRPDLLFILSAGIDTVLARIDGDGTRPARTSMEKAETLRKVQAVFQGIHDSGNYNSHVLDASLPVETIHERAWESFKALQENKRNKEVIQ